MTPFQPPINRPRPMPMPPQPQPQMNTGWRDAYMPFRQEPQRPMIPGFYISSPQDITPRDVPMDGSISFFPSNDLSYIMIKQWTGSGTIAEAKYVLEPQTPPPAAAQEQQTAEEPEPAPEIPANPEIVEVVSAALNEQTQRLTAAFSQIGLAFNTLQQKLDAIAPIPFSPAPVEPIAADPPEDTSKTPKPASRPKANKEPKENEKL